MEILFISESEVEQLLSMKEVLKSIEQAFREKALGRAQMPPKSYIFYSKFNGDLRTMPSYLEKSNISAVKIVNVHPENPHKFNLPTVIGTIVLIDPMNGAPLSIMGGTKITAIRTGAAGGIAAKYLANKNPKTVGLVGAGTQAKTQLLALSSIFQSLEEIRVWSRKSKSRQSFVSEMKSKLSLQARIISVKNVKDAVENVDIVITTTPSRKPLVKSKWVSAGTHINCIGADAPGKQELDPSILKGSKIVVDSWEQASHSGEINIPYAKGLLTKQDIWAELGDIIAGLKLGRTKYDEITIFVSTGLAIQDAVTADLTFKKAKEKKMGTHLEL